MKKFFKVTLASLMLAVVCVLASCAPSQKVADKINDAAKTEKTGDDWSLKKCQNKLGKEYDGILVKESGVATWTKKSGKTTKTIVVTFANGVAIGAVYSEKTEK